MPKRLTQNGIRTCSRCDRKFPATPEFFHRRGEGLADKCKTCTTEVRMEWRRNNPERFRASRRAWYAKYRERERERNRSWQERNHLAVKASNMRAAMKIAAEKKGVPFEGDVITTEFLRAWLERQKVCECCGYPFDFRVAGYRTAASPSIDRLVPEIGYVRTNVSLLCWRCNRLKSDATPEQLEAVARWMRSRLS